jgi:4-amino-4-deoxy-L-arabinose transferase-like glycosyltransferase
MLKKVFFLIFISIIFFFRFYSLSADPPYDFPLGFISDEGWWTHNARNLALFGSAITDQFNQGFIISFPFFILQSLTFFLFGVGFYQARLVSAVFGIFAIILFYLLIKKGRNNGTAITASFFFGINYVFLEYCRIALVDVLLIFFILLSIYSLNLKKSNNINWLISGFFLGLALITKSTASFVFIAIIGLSIFDYFMEVDKKKKILMSFVSYSIGISIVIGIWILFCIIPRGDEINILYSRLAYDNFHGSLITAFKNFFALFASITTDGIHISQFITKMPVENFLFYLFLVALLLQFLRHGIGYMKKIDRVDFLFLLILFFGFLTLSPMTHKPLRRYIVFIPFICYFAARFIEDIQELDIRELISHLRGRNILSPVALISTFIISAPFLILMSPVLALILKSSEKLLIKPLMNSLFPGFHISNYQVISVLILYIFSHMFIRFMCNLHDPDTFKFNISKKGALIIFFITNIYFYSIYFSHLTYTLKNESSNLGKMFNEATLVAGGVADTLCFENRARTAHIWESPDGKILNGNLIKTGQIDYVLSLKRADDIVIPTIELSSRLNLEYLDTLKLCPTKDKKSYRIEIELLKVIK